jgi:predicted transcriptional regulator
MNALSESVRILREAGVNEKQMLAHLEVIEQNMREHAVSPQTFNDFRTEMSEKFIKIDERFNKIEEKFNSIDGKFNSVESRFNKLEKNMYLSFLVSTSFLASLVTIFHFYK